MTGIVNKVYSQFVFVRHENNTRSTYLRLLSLSVCPTPESPRRHISVICTTKKYDRSYKCFCDVRKKRLFHNRPCTWQSSFSLTSRELYRIIFCLKVLLKFLCVYLLAKITLRDICHELSKQARVYFELICIAGQYAPTVLTLKP